MSKTPDILTFNQITMALGYKTNNDTKTVHFIGLEHSLLHMPAGDV